jgi:hypothetical protein
VGVQHGRGPTPVAVLRWASSCQMVGRWMSSRRPRPRAVGRGCTATWKLIPSPCLFVRAVGSNPGRHEPNASLDDRG